MSNKLSLRRSCCISLLEGKIFKIRCDILASICIYVESGMIILNRPSFVMGQVNCWSATTYIACSFHPYIACSCHRYIPCNCHPCYTHAARVSESANFDSVYFKINVGPLVTCNARHTKPHARVMPARSRADLHHNACMAYVLAQWVLTGGHVSPGGRQ